MYKFAAKTLDMQDEDLQDAIKKLGSDMPEFVRDAAIPDPKELNVISDFDFALVYYNKKGEKMRKYLLIDPGNIWLSAKYFLDARDSWPRIAQGIAIRAILSRAEKHGISKYPIFNGLREIKTSMESEGMWRKLPSGNVYSETLFDREDRNESVLRDQQARSGGPAKTPSEKLSSAKVYALKPGDDYWVDRPMYDITTSELVKKACDYFDMHKGSLPLKTKRKYASAVLQQADKLGMQVPETIALYGSNVVNLKLAHETLMRRAKLCGDEHRKLAADIIVGMKAMNADELVACVEAFDKKAFAGRGDRFSLPDPVVSVMSPDGDRKVLMDTGMKSMTLGDLKRIVTHKEAKLRELFDEKIVTSLAKDPEKAFKALPTPYKKMVAGLSN